MSRAIGHKKLGPGRLVCYISKMKEAAHEDAFAAVWGPYPNYDDIARFDYGRKLWRQPDMRARFLRHWTDERHPYKHRFLEQRELIEEVLSSSEPPEDLDQRLRARGTSLRCVAREIPPVFGSFF